MSGEDDAQRRITLRLDGVDEHHGHVMARALTDKLDKFLKTFASFERAFLRATKRQTDFEVVSLRHNSPAELGLRLVSRVASYHPSIAADWTIAQWDRIARGEMPDDQVDEDLIGDFAELTRKQDQYGYSHFAISYKSKAISLDEAAHGHALRLTAAKRSAMPVSPWRAGKALGTLTGELRSILDADSERQIVICPPVGPAQVLCVFTDQIREQIKRAMWQFVRVTGTITYSVKGPHPLLIEISGMETVPALDGSHISDGEGLFRDAQYEHWMAAGL